MNLSQKSIQELVKKLKKIENRLKFNIKLATKDLMEITYLLLVENFNLNNLSNHINSLKCTLIDNGNGFKIWTNDWIVIFNEYGTGIKGIDTHPDPGNYKYNIQSKYKDDKGRWKYYDKKRDKFFTTSGMKSKHMFYDVEEIIKNHLKDLYSSAINCSINDEQYNSFLTSIREK